MASSAKRLTERLRHLVEEANAIHVGSYEDDELGKLRARLVPNVTGVLNTGVKLFGDVLSVYEPGFDEPTVAGAHLSTSFCEDVDAAMAEPNGAERISNIAFMGRWELSRKESSLRERAHDADVWGLIELCGSARRKLLKSGVALETAICEHESFESELEDISLTEVQRSILTRKAYRKLRSAVLKDGPPDPCTLSERLKSAAHGIAQLVLDEIYSDLRVTDRMQLRKLRRRLQEHLAGESKLDADDAFHLWEDLASFSELLRLVNHRAQLRDHDVSLIRSLILDFEQSRAPDSLPPAATIERASDLLGRNDEIDHLLLHTAGTSTNDWLDALERALSQLHQDDSAGERAYEGDRALLGS